TAVGNRKRYREDAESDVSYRAIADHVRAISFLIAEGLRPGNGDREYVLRRLIRRAAGHARRLKVGMIGPLLVSACEGVVQVMGDAYDELVKHKEMIYEVVAEEERKFHTTLVTGELYLGNAIHRVRNEAYKQRTAKTDRLYEEGEYIGPGLVLPGS